MRAVRPVGAGQRPQGTAPHACANHAYLRLRRLACGFAGDNSLTAASVAKQCGLLALGAPVYRPLILPEDAVLMQLCKRWWGGGGRGRCVSDVRLALTVGDRVASKSEGSRWPC